MGAPPEARESENGEGVKRERAGVGRSKASMPAGDMIFNFFYKVRVSYPDENIFVSGKRKF